MDCFNNYFLTEKRKSAVCSTTRKKKPQHSDGVHLLCYSSGMTFFKTVHLLYIYSGDDLRELSRY